MTRNRLWLIVIFVFSSSCLWSPEIEQAEDEELFAPEIVLESLEPPFAGVTKILDSFEECERTNFSIGLVKDRNIDDVLYIRWYLDLDWSHPTFIRERVIAQTGEVERTSLNLTYQLQDLNTIDNETHTLDVFIFDRVPSDDDTPTFPDTPDGAEGQFDHHQWSFRKVPDGFCYE